jgi:hypothetical protein
MDYVNYLTKTFPLLDWIVSTLTGAKLLVWMCLIGAGVSAVDIVLEQQSGIAQASLRGNTGSATREKAPEDFARIIQFEVIRSIGLLVLAGFTAGSIAAVRNYDIFAPGQTFKSLDGDSRQE